MQSMEIPFSTNNAGSLALVRVTPNSNSFMVMGSAKNLSRTAVKLTIQKSSTPGGTYSDASVRVISGSTPTLAAPSGDMIVNPGGQFDFIVIASGYAIEDVYLKFTLVSTVTGIEVLADGRLTLVSPMAELEIA